MNLLQQNSKRRILIGTGGNPLLLLIIFNVIIYILLTFTDIVYLLTNSTEEVFKAKILSLFSLPAQPAVFGTRPWTLFSYMFTHFGLGELVSSQLWLWGFGFLLKEIIGDKKLIPLYLYGGFAGAIIFLLSVNVIPSISANVNSVYPLIGSGPAVMAVAIAATTLAPRYRIFQMINVPLWAVTVVYALIKFATIGYANPGHLAATFAGGIMGFVIIWQLQKGNDWCQWMSDLYVWFDNLFNPERIQKSTPTKEKLFYKSEKEPFKKNPHLTQKRVDDLLDKINHQGYDSLLQDEKDFLKKASREEL